MTDNKARGARGEFGSRVRLMVAGDSDVAERYAENLSEGGLFVRTDKPPPRDAHVILEFVLPDGTPLSRCAARVVHSKPGTGMGLEFVELDKVASEWVAKFATKSHSTPAQEEPARPSSRRVAVGSRQTDVAGPQGPSRLLQLSGPVVGIDLGTTNSCVAAVTDGEARVIVAPGGYETVPSIVHFGAAGDILVGHPARERMILEPRRAIYASKRFLGRPFASREVKSLAHFYNYELVQGSDGRVAARIGDEVIPLEAVAGQIIDLLKQIASHALGQPIQRAVITVPAYFGEIQRQAVRDAGRLAGLYVERILNEPTAAAVAYGFGRALRETVLVYDFGGGTFDASVLRIDGDRMEVLSTDGDPFLGGADLDDRLTEYALMTFEREAGLSLRDQPISIQRVRFAAEMAKMQLSQANTASINLPFITQVDDQPVDLNLDLTRDLLEGLTNDLIERTFGIVQKVLDGAHLKSDSLDDIILVGGQSRSPAVRRLLTERFGRKPCAHIHPDEAVALGAAQVAHNLGVDEPMDLTDVLAASIRVGLRDGKTAVLLQRGVRLPAEKKFEVTLNERANTKTRVFLYRGETPRADGNTLLGNLTLPGVPESSDGGRKATIVLGVSADGLLSVRAHHPSVGNIGEMDVLLL